MRKTNNLLNQGNHSSLKQLLGRLKKMHFPFRVLSSVFYLTPERESIPPYKKQERKQTQSAWLTLGIESG